MDSRPPIAYLAPEIPGLSASFVYNEILSLKSQGFSIVPFSIQVPKARAGHTAVDALQRETVYVYAAGLAKFLTSMLRVAIARPKTFARTLRLLAGDVVRIGLVNRKAIGLVYRFLAATYLAEQLRKHRCTHLHVHFAHVPADVGMYASSLAGIGFSVTAHANDLFERGWLLKEKLDRSRFFVAISEFNRSLLQRRHADPTKIHVIHCGVNNGELAAKHVARDDERPFTIGALGRMVEKKGFDDLLRAIALLKERGGDIRLELAGDGPWWPKLRRLAKSLGIEDRIEWLGAIDHDRVLGWLPSLDLFTLPCKQDVHGDMDGIPVALMEAMATGIPVVSTRLSGIPELIIDGLSGMLVEPSDPAGLADAIARLRDDPALRAELAFGARAKVMADFDLTRNARRLGRLFDDACRAATPAS